MSSSKAAPIAGMIKQTKESAEETLKTITGEKTNAIKDMMEPKAPKIHTHRVAINTRNVVT